MPGVVGEWIRDKNPLSSLLEARLAAERKLSYLESEIRSSGLLDSAIARAVGTPAYAAQRDLILNARAQGEVFLPRTEKHQIRDRYHDFVRSGRAGRVPSFEALTSGSTGSPLAIRRTIFDMALEEAFQRWWRGHYGWGKQSKVAVLRGRFAAPFAAGAIVEGSSRHRRIFLNSYRLSPRTVSEYVQLIKKHQTEVIYAYPSAVAELARLIECEGVSAPRVPLVVTSSEPLGIPARQIIQKVFGAEVVDWYGNSERSVAAAQCPLGRYHFFWNYSYVQVDEDGQIVSTPLRWQAFQLLGYKTGDIAVGFERSPCACGWPDPHASAIGGRVGDFVVTGEGARVWQLVSTLDGIDGILFGQFVQESDGNIVINLVMREKNESGLAQLLRLVRQKVPGRDIRIEIVDEIPRTQSGKFLEVIRHYHED